ncbi:hypothetical protein OSB04_028172 [Centaurea solstitialis]|uniref:Reverse transcriptase domain-containing protein n=1 Tax=Centaurea solstitialis TaxID=347529 RepID=A0AA38STG9_9ASTR|nr:hypothetical protein OSB04_028172 [Centaurea solstitialis]
MESDCVDSMDVEVSVEERRFAEGFPSLAENPPRVSVFQRLSDHGPSKRLQFSDVKKRNFASVVGDSKSTSLQFFPPQSKSDARVTIPIELAKLAAKRYHTTLVGYFLGSRVPFWLVQQSVKRAWGKFGFSELMMNSNGVYFLKFNDEGGCNQVISHGPLFIRDAPFFVSTWDPSKGLTKPVHSTCPLWIKLHNIPLAAFNLEGIGRIASTIGVPKQMDAATASMCDRAWGRPGFAKVLVEAWAIGELKREIEVVIPSLSGDGETMVKVKVEYLWEPIQCEHCMVFGHKKAACVKAVTKAKPKMKEVDADGFTKVPTKHWVPKAKPLDGASSSGTCKEDLVDKSIPSSVLDENLDATMVQENDVQQDERGPETSSPVRNQVVNIDSQEVLHDSEESLGEGLHGKPSIEQPIVDTVINLLQPPPAPSKPPIKGILKNTNRFSVLADEERRKKEISGKLGNSTKGSEDTSLGSGKLGKSTKGSEDTLLGSRMQGASAQTHVKADNLVSICEYVFGSWKWVSNSSVSDLGTRILIAWDEDTVDVMVLDTHAQFIHCFVKLRGQASFFITIVYGANGVIDRKQLWSGLRKAKVIMGTKPWVIMGDFNSMLFPHDGFGGCSRRNLSMDDFGACVEDVEVVDLSYTGIQYTWIQKPKGGDGLHRKLDRIMGNVEFMASFEGSRASFNPAGISDHAIGLLHIAAIKRNKVKGFKFDNFIADHDEFLHTVSIEWGKPVFGSFMHKLLTHLKRLKQPLRRLRGRFGDISRKVSVLKNELDAIQLACDLDPSNPELLQDLAHLLVAYEQALLDENTFLKQRAKVKWLNDGDANTKFFHNVVKERRGRNTIRSIADSNGSFVYDDAVGDVLFHHFRIFLGMRDMQVSSEMPLDLFVNRLSLAESLHMIRPITDDDIKWAVFNIGNDKAPGSDGFSARFFKKAWHVVGNDVLLAIHNFFYTGRLTKEINHTLLCLIPKVPNASSISDFRPISCCTVLYKIISKIISERLKPYLSSLISPTQSAFIPGRRISDNILLAHELVAGYQTNKGQPRCAFKIDLRKAYDTVDWGFLACMLEGFGFHPVFRHWIDEMLRTSSFSISINGDTHGFFKGARGLRQGDPISPYLFTIVMEGFSMILKQCIVEAESFTYHQHCQDLSITHLCFADDLFVFTGGDLESVEVLKRALDLFRIRSGLEPNLAKSDVFFCNVLPENKDVILQTLPLHAGTFPIRYLGVPLSPTCLRVGDFNPLMDRVKQRIHNWKSKFLSFGGRKQLITSVLQSMQLYWMSVFALPSSVIHDLEKLFRDFLWAQGEQSRGKCKVAWETVCKPINCGGLGFKRLALWNRTLLTKHIWDILTHRKTLWVDWIWNHRIMHGSFWSIVPRQNWSWSFRKLLGIRSSIRNFFVYKVGDGTSINAWEDIWFSNGPLSSLISFRRFHASGFSLDSVVVDVISHCDGAWPQIWMESNTDAFSDPMPVLDVNSRDSLSWRGPDLIGTSFTVQQAWRSLDGPHIIIPWTKYVWFKGNIPKHSFCLWSACYIRLPTQDRILAWKEVPPDFVCSLCGVEQDSHDHLFFRCPYAIDVWRKVKNEVGLHGFHESWNLILQDLVSGQGPGRLIQKLALAASVYFIWMERNNRLFKGMKRPSIQVFKEIRKVILDRMAWRHTLLRRLS